MSASTAQLVAEVPSAFGRQLRQVREERGLSQALVAATMRDLYGLPGWYQTTVAKTESAERPVKLAEALALAFIVGATLPVLMGDAPARPPSKRAALAEVARMERHLAERRRELEED